MKLTRAIAGTALSMAVSLGLIWAIGTENMWLLAAAVGFLWWCW